MNTDKADKNKVNGAKPASAKSLLRKLNANMGETLSELDELGVKLPDASDLIQEHKPVVESTGVSRAGLAPETERYRIKQPEAAESSSKHIAPDKTPVVSGTLLQRGADPGSETKKPASKSTRDEDSPVGQKSEPPGRIVYRFRRSGKKPAQTAAGSKTIIDGKAKGRAADKAAGKDVSVLPDNAPTKQFDSVYADEGARSSELAALMKKYLSEEEYKSYQRRQGGAELPGAAEFEAAHSDPVSKPPRAGELSAHDRAEIEAETLELTQEDIDIKKRIRDAEDYVRSITDTPPVTMRESGTSGENDFDETDVNLMIAFGMDDELANTIGIDRVNQIEANLARDIDQYDEAAESGEHKVKEVFEFTSNDQVKGIFRGYKIAYRKLLLKLLVCLALLAASFIYENIGLFGGQLPPPFNSAVYPITYIMIDLQLVLICGMLVWRFIAEGAISLFRMKPTPSSVLFGVIALTIIYDVLMCFAGIREDGIKLYGFPAILCVFLMLVSRYYNLRREIFSFNIAASKRLKYAIDRLEPEESKLESEAFGEYMPESPSIFRISRTAFIDGFYRRSNGYSGNKSIIGATIPLVVIISAIFFVAGYYVTGDAVDSLTTAFMAFMMCMPASVFLLYSYPIFKASSTAFQLESAIIGESSVDEYTTASAITFDDKDVFPSTGVKVRSVKVYGSNRIDHVIYNAASIFSVAGGSLADVFDIATIDLGHSDDVEILDVEADGLEATVNGTHIYLGRAPYLRRNSFVPVRDADDEELEGGGEICIMYMVIGEEVAAKMYVQYHIDPDFEFILKQLYSAGVCVGIKTSDPNIDDRMMGMRVKLDKYPVKVLKCKNLSGSNETKERVDSGVVSKSSVKALLQTLALCDKVQHITKTNIVIKLFAILIGVLLSAFLLALGLSTDVMSFYVALYQLFWILPMIMISKLFIN